MSGRRQILALSAVSLFVTMAKSALQAAHEQLQLANLPEGANLLLSSSLQMTIASLQQFAVDAAEASDAIHPEWE